MIPSLMYVGSHMDHHERMGFGTNDDPEYARIPSWSRLKIAAFVFAVALFPIALAVRWGVLGPLSRLFPPLRPFVVGRLSTLVINSNYVRPMPEGDQIRRWNAQEAGTSRVRMGRGRLGVRGLDPDRSDRSVGHRYRRRSHRESGADAHRARLRERRRADGRRGPAPRLDQSTRLAGPHRVDRTGRAPLPRPPSPSSVHPLPQSGTRTPPAVGRAAAERSLPSDAEGLRWVRSAGSGETPRLRRGRPSAQVALPEDSE